MVESLKSKGKYKKFRVESKGSGDWKRNRGGKEGNKGEDEGGKGCGKNLGKGNGKG